MKKIIMSLLLLILLQGNQINAALADVKRFEFNVSGLMSRNTPVSYKNYNGISSGGCGRKESYVINTQNTGINFRLRNQLFNQNGVARSSLKLGAGNARICGHNYATRGYYYYVNIRRENILDVGRSISGTWSADNRLGK